MPWIIFVIIAVLLYSSSNFIDKYLIENKVKDPFLISIFLGIISLPFGILVLIFQGFHGLTLSQLALVLFSGFLLVLYFIPYFKAMNTDDASRVVPLFAFVPVFSLILSYLFLGEKLTVRELMGFIIVLCGGFILSAEKVEKRMFLPRKALYLMMLSSLLYALSGIIFKFVSVKENFLTSVAYQNIGMGFGAIVLLVYQPFRKSFFRESKKFDLKTWFLIFLDKLSTFPAQVLLFYAYLLAPVALVTVTASGIQPFVVLFFGILISLYFPRIVKEDIQKATLGIKIFSIILICIGIYFIYL